MLFLFGRKRIVIVGCVLVAFVFYWNWRASGRLEDHLIQLEQDQAKHVILSADIAGSSSPSSFGKAEKVKVPPHLVDDHDDFNDERVLEESVGLGADHHEHRQVPRQEEHEVTFVVPQHSDNMEKEPRQQSGGTEGINVRPVTKVPQEPQISKSFKFPLEKSYIVQPVQRPCGAHLERNQHFVDKAVWHAIKPQEMDSRRREWQQFLSEQIPLFKYEDYGFRGCGIVYTATGRTYKRALASIQLLRGYGCTLPVQIWYIGNELSKLQIEEIHSHSNVHCKDIQIEQLLYPQLSDFKIGHAYGETRNYHIKTLVLLLTEFEQILYLDSDNMPLRDPQFLFDSKEFKETGALFWRDFWKFPSDNPLWQITGLPCEDEWEQESGQLVLDKKRAWKPLLMSMFFQKNHEFYFKIILGDKDTYRFAWKVTETPYHMMQHHCGIGGRIRQGRFCGHTMLQPGTDGIFLFAHTTSMKSTNALKEGNTWEMMEYMVPADSRVVKATSDSVTVKVGYPITYEYSGGVEKRSEEGGIGSDTFLNPCLGYGIMDTQVDTTPETVEKLGLKNAVDSYKVVTESFSNYNKGMFQNFEHLYYQYGGIGSKSESTCGNGIKGNGICSNPDDCCSAWGWCGNSVDFCAIGCLGGPCYNKRVLPADPAPDFPYCGEGKVGFGLCKDTSLCCSKFGWCGPDGSDSCNAKNCISGPCGKS